MHGGYAENCGDGVAGMQIVHNQVDKPTSRRRGMLRLERIPLRNGKHFAQLVGMNCICEATMVPVRKWRDAVNGDLSGK